MSSFTFCEWVEVQHKNQAMGKKRQEKLSWEKTKLTVKMKWAEKTTTNHPNKTNEQKRRQKTRATVFSVFLFFCTRRALEHSQHTLLEHIKTMNTSIHSIYRYTYGNGFARCVWPQFLLTATICFSLLCLSSSLSPCVCCVLFCFYCRTTNWINDGTEILSSTILFGLCAYFSLPLWLAVFLSVFSLFKIHFFHLIVGLCCCRVFWASFVPLILSSCADCCCWWRLAAVAYVGVKHVLLRLHRSKWIEHGVLFNRLDYICLKVYFFSSFVWLFHVVQLFFSLHFILLHFVSAFFSLLL